MGRRPNSMARKELKEAVKSELMRRSVVDTELIDVPWLFKENEVWLTGTGEKREKFLKNFGAAPLGFPFKCWYP